MPRLTVDLSTEIDDKLNEIARKRGMTKAETMRKAFALLKVAEEQEAQGNTLGIVRQDQGEFKAIGIVPLQ